MPKVTAGVSEHSRRSESIHILGTRQATVQLALATMRGTFPFHQRFFYRAGTAERSLTAAVRAAELFRITGDDAQ